MASEVRKIAESFLGLHFGERCPEFEYGCEACRRYALLDRLLEYEQTHETLKQEIVKLEDSLKWRKEMLAKLSS
jgi:hypothetical protein